jgi:hypothetical protein
MLMILSAVVFGMYLSWARIPQKHNGMDAELYQQPPYLFDFVMYSF